MSEIIPKYLFPNIPLWAITSSFLVMCVAVAIMASHRWFASRKIIVGALLAEYVFLVLCALVICRPEANHYKLTLQPFWSYNAIAGGKSSLILEDVLNVILFIPVGLLLSYFRRFRKWWKVLGMGFVLSSVIELSQHIFNRGFCETDDVIHNTLGAQLGFLLFKLITSMVRRIKTT